jgi:hypothetical protein
MRREGGREGEREGERKREGEREGGSVCFFKFVPHLRRCTSRSTMLTPPSSRPGDASTGKGATFN